MGLQVRSLGTLCVKFMIFKKIYFQGATIFYSQKIEIKDFTNWGSNLRAQRCLTYQIGRTASLSTWPTLFSFRGLWKVKKSKQNRIFHQNSVYWNDLHASSFHLNTQNFKFTIFYPVFSMKMKFSDVLFLKQTMFVLELFFSRKGDKNEFFSPFALI